MLIIYTDGACFGNPGPMGIGIVIYRGRKKIKEISEYIGKGTNNIAEYTAVLRALEITKNLGESEVKIRSDSLLLINQLNGKFKVKRPHLQELKAKIDEIAKGMIVKFEWVPREQNALADFLSKNAIEKINKIKTSK